MLWRIGWALGALIVLGCVGLGVARVGALETHEVRSVIRTSLAEAEALSAGGGVTLSRVRLEQDQVVSFEMCAEDPMLPGRWAGALSVAVARPGVDAVMTESELTEEVLGLVRRNELAGCLRVGSGTIGQTDDYTVEARWERRPSALEDVPLVVRVVGRRPLDGGDLALVFGTWLGGLLMVLALALRPRDGGAAADRAVDDAAAEWEAAQREARGERGPSRLARLAAKVPDWARAVLGVGLMAGLFFAMGFIRVGAAGGAALMIVIATLEIGVALALVRGAGLAERLEGLGLVRPRRWYIFFPLAVLGGVVLWYCATQATRLVPSTGVSSVEMLVSWPSGLLSFALPAVVVPIAEEVFFRGFVFGAFERRSRALAFTMGWLLFVLAHVPQTFGQWGALVAITVAGLGFTTLRTVSRSTLISATAHLFYNGILALGAMA